MLHTKLFVIVFGMQNSILYLFKKKLKIIICIQMYTLLYVLQLDYIIIYYIYDMFYVLTTVTLLFLLNTRALVVDFFRDPRTPTPPDASTEASSVRIIA